VVGQFCRNWLNPILATSNVALLAIHHTGKPAKDIPPRKGQSLARTFSDRSYGMLGSSELTNWARAIMILNELPEDKGYELVLTKRGQRAGASHPNGAPTRIVHLKHSTTDIFWTQTDPPEEPASATDTAPAAKSKIAPPTFAGTPLGKANAIATANLSDFLAACSADGEKEAILKKRLIKFSGDKLGINIRGKTINTTVDALIANHKLARTETGLYTKGPTQPHPNPKILWPQTPPTNPTSKAPPQANSPTLNAKSSKPPDANRHAPTSPIPSPLPPCCPIRPQCRPRPRLHLVPKLKP
jgi:hypothetical protein